MPAGQTVPDRVEYYYQAVSTGAEAGDQAGARTQVGADARAG